MQGLPQSSGLLRSILEDRLITAPNAITLSRLLMLPFFFLLMADEAYAPSALVLGIMGATDWFDGQVARRFDQVSELGKVLDPAADRIVLIASVAGVLWAGVVPVWLAVPVLVREPVMFMAVPLLAVLGAKRIDVTWHGKAGTFLLMFAFPALLYGASDAPLAGALEATGIAVGIAGVLLSYYAAIAYIPMARRALREGRLERARA